MDTYFPLVSIITPCYNAASYIGETIESVLAQTYTNWEMLIVDDCSTDKSKETILSYIAKDDRIKYFKTITPSGSPAVPRNIGLDNSHGEYVAFLDADDLWLPEKLEKQVEYCIKSGDRFVYSDYEKIDLKGNKNNRLIKMPPKSTYWDVLETCTIPCLTVLIAKDLIGTHRFRSIPKEDFAFWLELLKQGEEAFNQGEVLALYREQPNSRSSNKFKMIRNQWYVLRRIERVKPLIAIYFMVTFLTHGLLKFLK